jgi:hypothetical protein
MIPVTVEYMDYFGFVIVRQAKCPHICNIDWKYPTRGSANEHPLYPDAGIGFWNNTL